MTGIAGYPSNQEGWGLVQLDNILFFPGGAAQSARVGHAQRRRARHRRDRASTIVDVASNAQPLKITLVWTDPPGGAGSATPVVNNLDLEVISPDGTQTFRGNVFADGVSATGGAADTAE